MSAYFVAGTDTSVGKTRVSCALLHALHLAGHARVVGMKPVAAGCEWIGGQWLNDDVVQLRAASTLAVPAEFDNPYALPDAVSPHIAARKAGVLIDLAHIEACFHALRQHSDAVVVEGAGGFMVPLHEDAGSSGGTGGSAPWATTADMAQRLQLPVVLVVGLRLGCLSHALLTQEAIAARGLKLVGWVANTISPEMAEQAANVDTLRQRIEAPMLAHWGWAPAASLAAYPLLTVPPA